MQHVLKRRPPTRLRLVAVAAPIAIVAFLVAPRLAPAAEAEGAGDDSHAAAADSEGHGHEGGAAKPDPLATDPDLAIWTLLVFLGLLGVLRQVAWKPILEGLKAREDGITGKLAAAEAKHEEARRLLAEHQAKLTGAAEEVRAMLEEARRDAEHAKSDIVNEAKSAAEAERTRAVRDIEQARDVAVRQLAERTAGLAIDLAAKVVRQEITSGRQAEIVSEALDRLAKPVAN